jgi:phosphoribosylformylglycinamidine synthase subunit PurSL
LLTRIEVGQKSPATDAKGRKLLATLREDFHLPVEKVETVAAYTLEMVLGLEEQKAIAESLLCDPITESYALVATSGGAASAQAPVAKPGFAWLVEVGYKPGVTDNVGRSTREGIADLLGRTLTDDEQVYTSRQFFLHGSLSREQAEVAAKKVFANDLIESWLLLSGTEWQAQGGVKAASNKVVLAHEPTVSEIALPANDADLLHLSDEKILALSLEEMRAIRAHFADPERQAARKTIGLPAFPTDVELEAIAQTWSEHCKHKIFAADIEYTDASDGKGETTTIRSLYKTYVKAATEAVRPKAPWLKSVFTDNAGIIAFCEGWDVAMKAETHNSPSALDPYGGAMTGIVGVNRDILGCGLGCQPIFNTDVFCFASPFYDKAIPGKLHHPRRLLKEVHRGVKDGGNESGIPTVNGSIVFDDRYLGKPLVFCGTGGLIPSTINGQPSWQKSIEPGDRIVMAGGRIGKDGIHGATFSSAALTTASPTSAVQIGDPITQKKLLDFLLEARDLGLYRFVTDNGAGGLSSSLGEMARESGGCEVHLDKALLKYAGLDPWEILLSEAQERMSFAVPPEKMAAFMDLAQRRGVEASDLGSFTGHGYLDCFYRGKQVARLDMQFLHDGNPRMRLKARWMPPRHLEPPQHDLAMRDLKADALNLLARLNICSKETWVRQYDHEVQGRSVVKPFVGQEADGPSDAAVVRPLYDRPEGLVVSHGIVPRYSDIDAYHMAQNAVDEAVRNAVAVGGEPGKLAALDNFCWPDPVESEQTPDGQYKLAQLVRCNQGLYDICVAYGLPLISGKDSMKNDYGKGKDKISVPPTLLVTVIGVMQKAEQAVTMDFQKPGDVIYALGITGPELGGSEYYQLVGGPSLLGQSVPRVNPVAAFALYQALSQAIKADLVLSCHDLSDGGLFVGLAESCMAGRLGAEIDLSTLPVTAPGLPAHALLFSESASRFVVSVASEQAAAFERAMAGQPCSRIGQVTETRELHISAAVGSASASAATAATPIFTASVDALFARWRQPLDF